MKSEEYPRPLMKRDNIIILDGTWELEGRDIIVPYPPQSEASGWQGNVPEKMRYSLRFSIEPPAEDRRILLHFGAVDQVAEVSLNGAYLGRHEGGYMGFSFDVTERISDGTNVLTVEVTDSLSHFYPWGKQSKEPSGMWYTPVSGIWQSVWLESVPRRHVNSLSFTGDPASGRVSWEASATCGGTYVITVYAGDEAVVRQESDETGGMFVIPREHLHPWSPDDPFLYRVRVSFCGEDNFSSYFALRSICVRQIGGIKRVCLNDRPVFLHGVLDQGYFPEGIFVPPSMSDYEEDIVRLKELGFNTIRKHIKVEPEAFYYACDRLGMLVIQDMVNSGDYSFFRDTLLPTLGRTKRDDRVEEPDGRMEFFVKHMQETAFRLYGHPCVIAYTVFNEGWGQFNADSCYRTLRELDPTRLIDTASGWFEPGLTDLDSVHVYFRAKELSPSAARPMLLSECGGFTLDIDRKHRGVRWGYGRCRSPEKLTRRIEAMYRKMVIPAIEKGLCGCIYTQLCDVENEINGLYTYDRSVCKVIPERLAALSEVLYSTLEKSVQ
ncbi:MAG: glycoside hydrolase family 2 [Eubacteriaceae bacterium]|nr:glycoside hydrolase family 2 [Eubacteriaceae bacterium]